MSKPPPLPPRLPPPLPPKKFLLVPYEASPYYTKPPLPANPGRCDICHMPSPVAKLGFNRHIGAVILMFHKSSTGWFCRDCSWGLFKTYTPVTFLFGWWGLISFFITPIVLVYNTVSLIRSRFLRPGMLE